jgi:hypothetical protein
MEMNPMQPAPFVLAGREKQTKELEKGQGIALAFILGESHSLRIPRSLLRG